MFDYTDLNFRCLLRLVSREAVLWTEMVKDSRLVYSTDNPRMLRAKLDMSCPQREPPVILQLGGADPEELAEAVRIARPWGYTGLNLNCGCPSEKTIGRKGRTFSFGASLMSEPQLVSECCLAMAAAAAPGVEVSVKCRVGSHRTIEDMERDGDSYERFAAFIDTVAARGRVRRFIVHARCAILEGLSPKKNRQVPPLRHDFVHRLAAERPDLNITVNGGIRGMDEVARHGTHGVDVMVGRWVLKAPWDLADEGARRRGRRAVIEDYMRHCERQTELGRDHLKFLIQPLLPLFNGVPDQFRYREQILEPYNYKPRDGGFPRLRAAVDRALAALPPEALEPELEASPNESAPRLVAS